ncbi:hypothetical protein ACHAXS_013684 [Conticribra weissflogii]
MRPLSLRKTALTAQYFVPSATSHATTSSSSEDLSLLLPRSAPELSRTSIICAVLFHRLSSPRPRSGRSWERALPPIRWSRSRRMRPKRMSA